MTLSQEQEAILEIISPRKKKPRVSLEDCQAWSPAELQKVQSNMIFISVRGSWYNFLVKLQVWMLLAQ